MKASKMMVPVLAMMAAGMLAADVAQATAIPTILQGTRSLNVSGWLDDDGEDLNVYAAGSFGYFVRDFVQAGVFASVDIYGSDYKMISGGVFGEYNVDLGGPVVPYVGVAAALGWVDAFDETDTVLEARGYGGARYFFVDYAAIGADLNVAVASEDIYNRGDDAVDFWLMLNTSWYF